MFRRCLASRPLVGLLPTGGLHSSFLRNSSTATVTTAKEVEAQHVDATSSSNSSSTNHESDKSNAAAPVPLSVKLLRPVDLSAGSAMLRPRDPFFGYSGASEPAEVLFATRPAKDVPSPVQSTASNATRPAAQRKRK